MAKTKNSTWLDRAIGWASPKRGVARAHARLAIASLGYEGARKDRRTEGWITTSNDADSEVGAAVRDLRNRSRDLVRNNPYISNAADVKVTETIGAGIVAEWKSKELKRRWKLFVANADYDGNLDLYGLQALIERCRVESGEVLVRFMDVELSPEQVREGRVPFQLRVLEPDYIDTSMDGPIIDRPGAHIRFGIQYSPVSKVEGYWLFRTHPGGSAPNAFGSLSLKSDFVPAADVLHIFRRLRAGQTRGVTDFAPAMLRIRDLDDYDDAEGMRKKLEACLAAFVTSPPGANTNPLGGLSSDSTGRVETLYPAMVTYLNQGEDVRSVEPKASGGYADFQRFNLRAVSAGIGVPYELVTGDLSQVNYSSYRAGLIRFRGRIEQDQLQVHIPGHCRPIANRFLDEVRGLEGKTYKGRVAEVSFTPPRFELMDPIKETQADLEAVLAGFETWPEIVRRRGWNAGEQLEAIAEWQKMIAEKGVVLKSDYRTEIAKGASAPASDPADDEDDEEEAA